MLPSILWFTFIAAVFAVGFQALRRRSPGRRRPYPPGPPSYPLIGHLLSIPSGNQQVEFHELAKKYGSIMHMEVFGQHTVILDNLQTCTDLLEKRSSLYSDRPEFVFVEIMDAVDLPMMPYGRRFREHRKFIHSRFTTTACTQFLQSHRQNAIILASNLLISPESQCEDYLILFASSTVTKAMTGFSIVSPDDEWIQLMKAQAKIGHDVKEMGGDLLEFLPFLQYLPSWFPGTASAVLGRSQQTMWRRLFDKAYDYVQQQITEGRDETSILSAAITEANPASDEQVDVLKRASGASIRAASDTTASVLHSFILLMTLYPEVQQRAQEEIDRVVGSERLPEFEDELPYVSALVQECFRWNPVVPLAIPHKSVRDDIYKDYFIPKGTLVIPNVYAMSRDENVYQDPAKFDPARFLPRPEGREEPPFQSAFGFGRRICPGRHFASNGVWIAVTTCLATLQFSKQVDANGVEIVPNPEFSSAAISAPKSFPFKVSARSDKALSLLQAAAQEALHGLLGDDN